MGAKKAKTAQKAGANDKTVCPDCAADIRVVMFAGFGDRGLCGSRQGGSPEIGVQEHSGRVENPTGVPQGQSHRFPMRPFDNLAEVVGIDA